MPEDPFDQLDEDHGGRAVELLRQTRPWLLFVGGSTLLASLAWFVWLCLAIGLSLFDSPNLRVAVETSAGGFCLALFPVVVALFGYQLVRMSMVLASLTSRNRRHAVATFLHRSRDFWRIVGAATLIFGSLWCGGGLLLGLLDALRV